MAENSFDRARRDLARGILSHTVDHGVLQAFSLRHRHKHLKSTLSAVRPLPFESAAVAGDVEASEFLFVSRSSNSNF